MCEAAQRAAFLFPRFVLTSNHHHILSSSKLPSPFHHQRSVIQTAIAGVPTHTF